MIAIKNKIFWDKTAKDLKYLFTEKYKIVLRDIVELNKWRDIPCSRTERLNIAKMLVFHKRLCIESMQIQNLNRFYMGGQT
jgi:hypothetical protein